jgi:hypothetical protein
MDGSGKAENHATRSFLRVSLRPDRKNCLSETSWPRQTLCLSGPAASSARIAQANLAGQSLPDRPLMWQSLKAIPSLGKFMIGRTVYQVGDIFPKNGVASSPGKSKAESL